MTEDMFFEMVYSHFQDYLKEDESRPKLRGGYVYNEEEWEAFVFAAKRFHGDSPENLDKLKELSSLVVDLCRSVLYNREELDNPRISRTLQFLAHHNLLNKKGTYNA